MSRLRQLTLVWPKQELGVRDSERVQLSCPPQYIPGGQSGARSHNTQVYKAHRSIKHTHQGFPEVPGVFFWLRESPGLQCPPGCNFRDHVVLFLH